MTEMIPGDGPRSDQARVRERERRVLRSGAASAAHQVLSALCTVATVPLVIRRLTPEEFGVWITLSSVLLLLGFLDLGIGSALVGAMARVQAAGDKARAQEMISSAFLGLTALSTVLGGLFWAVYPHVPWGRLLGVPPSGPRASASLSVAVVVVGILASLPLNVAARAQTGLQEGESVVVWRSVGTVVQLASIVVMFVVDASLVWFVVAVAAGPVLGNLANSIALFAGARGWLHVRVSKASVETFRELASAGFLFFVLSLAFTVAYQSDVLLVAHYLGSAKAGEYGVPFRLFMFVPTIVGLALLPLWPAYADAWHAGDRAWIEKTFRRSSLFALSANGAAGLALLLLARPVLRLWVGDAVRPSTTFLFAMFLYVLVWGASGTMAMLLNGCNVVKFQIVVAVAMVAVNLPLSIALLSPLGVAGPVVGTLVAQTGMVLVPTLLYKRVLLRRAGEGQTSTTGAQDYWRDSGRRADTARS